MVAKLKDCWRFCGKELDAINLTHCFNEADEMVITHHEICADITQAMYASEDEATFHHFFARLIGQTDAFVVGRTLTIWASLQIKRSRR